MGVVDGDLINEWVLVDLRGMIYTVEKEEIWEQIPPYAKYNGDVQNTYVRADGA